MPTAASDPGNALAYFIGGHPVTVAQAQRMPIDMRTGAPTPVGQQYGNLVAGFVGGMGEVPRPGITAYHGSPHSFDRFDISKIGTGEGAQAYGHGLYFAGNEDVARSYRDSLSNGQLYVDGKKVGEAGELGNDPVANAAQVLLLHGRDPVAAKAGVQAGIDRQAAGGYGYSRSLGNAIIKQIDRLADANVELRPGGNMYQVQLNVDPDRLLDYDKPISQQSPQVQEAFGYRKPPMSDDEFNSHIADLRQAGRDGEADWEIANRNYHTSRGAMVPSQVYDLTNPSVIADLQQRGIPGIKYLDQGSRGAGEGSHNYVMFSDDTINILKKYGLAGLLAGGLGAGAVMPGQQSNQ
jgi:hypothetical protein